MNSEYLSIQHLFITAMPFSNNTETTPGNGSAHTEKPAMKKIVVTAFAAIIASGVVLTSAQTASAQYYDGGPRYYDSGPRYDRRGPPPRPYRDPPRKHRDRDNGRIIAGGIAAGVLGGIVGGALAGGNGPRYVEPPPPPPPRCWFEDRQVRNAYDGGWHMESLRVCQ